MNKAYKQIVREQCAGMLGKATDLLSQLVLPKEGWIRTARKALGMSGSALSHRLNSSRTGAAYLEKAELEGKITINKLREAAEALDCHLVYGFVPNISIEDTISKQAEFKARSLSNQADAHMMLEAQSLSDQELEVEVMRLKQQLIRDMPNDFWKTSK